jgi:hypothetical protein
LKERHPIRSKEFKVTLIFDENIAGGNAMVEGLTLNLHKLGGVVAVDVKEMDEAKELEIPNRDS